MHRRSFIAGTLTGVTGPAAAWLGYGQRRDPPPPTSPPPGRPSYSQMGEDLILYELLHSWMKIRQPTYLDLGAADPVQASNTYLLYTEGSRGVLVEPNPAYVARLRRVRPKDVVVGVGVGVDGAAEADYYVFRDRPMFNTFSAAEVAMRQRQSTDLVVEKVVRIPLVPVNDLIGRYLGRAPDLLSIDIEGLDLPVLRTLDFEKYRPAAIIAEAGRPGNPNTEPELLELLESKGYVACGASLYNTVFGDRRRYG